MSRKSTKSHQKILSETDSCVNKDTYSQTTGSEEELENETAITYDSEGAARQSSPENDFCIAEDAESYLERVVSSQGVADTWKIRVLRTPIPDPPKPKKK